MGQDLYPSLVLAWADGDEICKSVWGLRRELFSPMPARLSRRGRGGPGTTPETVVHLGDSHLALEQRLG